MFCDCFNNKNNTHIYDMHYIQHYFDMIDGTFLIESEDFFPLKRIVFDNYITNTIDLRIFLYDSNIEVNV